MAPFWSQLNPLAIDKVIKWKHKELWILVIQNVVLEEKFGFLGMLLRNGRMEWLQLMQRRF